MQEFLRRLKLIDTMTTTLPTSKVEFVNRLNEITDEGSTGILSDPFDIFSSSEKEFKGQVNSTGFKIKRRRKFFDTNKNFAVATGTFKEDIGQLTVETTINGYNNFFIVFYVFLLIFYSVFIIGILFSDAKEVFFVIPFLFLHGIIMFAIPYFIMRRSVKRMKYELEREFFFFTKGF